METGITFFRGVLSRASGAPMSFSLKKVIPGQTEIHTVLKSMDSHWRGNDKVCLT